MIRRDWPTISMRYVRDEVSGKMEEETNLDDEEGMEEDEDDQAEEDEDHTHRDMT